MMCLLSNTYVIAKYNSSIGISGERSVSIWNVNIDTSDNGSDNLNIVSGNLSASYIIKVSSLSEVSTTYSIILTNVPNGLEVKLDNGSYQTVVNNTVQFNDVDMFLVSGNISEYTHVLSFNDPLNTSNSGLSSIDIDVVFNQID